MDKLIRECANGSTGSPALVRGRDLMLPADAPKAWPGAGSGAGSGAELGAGSPCALARGWHRWDRWHLGVPEVGRLLGAGGLATDGLHEVKPALVAGGLSAADQASALLFALLLARRRLDSLDTLSDVRGSPPARSQRCGVPGAGSALLWCAPQGFQREAGRLHAPGLAHLGIDPGRVLLVETRTRDETLWVLEETLRSGVAALVVGVVDEVALTPARRLALAAAQAATPCLIVTAPRCPPAASVATRWRIGRTRSGSYPLAARVPGWTRIEVRLERCRGRPLLAELPPVTLEWSDETASFHLVAGLADRTDAPCAGHGTWSPATGTRARRTA